MGDLAIGVVRTITEPAKEETEKGQDQILAAQPNAFLQDRDAKHPRPAASRRCRRLAPNDIRQGRDAEHLPLAARVKDSTRRNRRLLLPILLILLLSACGDPAGREAETPASSPDPHPVVSGTASAGATGSISGTVSVKNPPGSIIFVALGNDYDELSMGRVVRGKMMQKPGPFHFGNLRPGTYRVGAFIDLNGNLIPDVPIEPYVISSIETSVAPGENVEGVLIDSLFNERYASFKTPERVSLYNEMLGEAKERAQSAYEKLNNAESELLNDVMPSLRAMIYEAEKAWALAGNESDWEQITGLLEPVSSLAEGASAGKNLLGELRGCFLRAYVSELDGSVQPYAVAVPDAYDGKRPFPLIIALHGAGGDHWAGLKMVTGYSAFVVGAKESNSRFFPPNLPPDFIIACPNGHGYQGPGYREKGEYDVMKVLKEMFANYNIDADRVYLTGASKGGRGAWEIGMKHPELFAAIAPVAGAPDRAEKMVGATGDMSFFVFHGRKDKIMPVEYTRKMVVLLIEAEVPIEYEEIEDWGHEASVLAYRDESIIRLFRQ